MAVKCILVGFGLLVIPKRFELNLTTLSLHSFFQLPMELTPEEISWVTHLGRFKAHFTTLKDSEPGAIKVSC